MKKLSNYILWIFIVLYGVMSMVGALSALTIFPVIAFGLLHGAKRYEWRGIPALLIITVMVSNILEVISIRTGFPFGQYHYTAAVGPLIGLLPLLGLALFLLPILLG